jgi:hypothetical protein
VSVQGVVSNIKRATVAIGLAYKDDPQRIRFEGSRFLISDDGFFATAEHVLVRCRIRRKEINYRKKKDRGSSLCCLFW